MYPDLFGIPDFSYTLMLLLGIFSAIGLLIFYLWKQKINRNGIIDTIVSACAAIVFGVMGAILTQNLYNFIKEPNSFHWAWGMTFYGGLFFGVGSFLLVFYLLERKQKNVSIKEILIIAPACITLAHAFGRIGCLLAGCCYGIETNAWFGLQCSEYDSLKRVPTQLFEAIFLFILSFALSLLAFKKKFTLNFPMYMLAYGVFRFVIEFFRDDERGGANIGLSPSQIWCIVLVACSIPLAIVFRKFIFNKENN